VHRVQLTLLGLAQIDLGEQIALGKQKQPQCDHQIQPHQRPARDQRELPADPADGSRTGEQHQRGKQRPADGLEDQADRALASA